MILKIVLKFESDEENKEKSSKSASTNPLLSRIQFYAKVIEQEHNLQKRIFEGSKVDYRHVLLKITH